MVGGLDGSCEGWPVAGQEPKMTIERLKRGGWWLEGWPTNGVESGRWLGRVADG